MVPPARHLLLLDTCGAAATVALAALGPAALDATADPTRVGTAPAARIVSLETLPGRSASERLLPTIRTLLAQQEDTVRSLAALAVVTGPGSFTGVRIGVSAAKGLAEALDIPILGLSRLAVLAANSPTPESLAVLDAGRSELYCGHYRSGECLAERLLTRDAVLALAAGNSAATLLACETSVAELLRETASSGSDRSLAGRLVFVTEPSAADALPLALTLLDQCRFADPATLDANYVRRTDSELFAHPPRRTPTPA